MVQLFLRCDISSLSYILLKKKIIISNDFIELYVFENKIGFVIYNFNIAAKFW